MLHQSFKLVFSEQAITEKYQLSESFEWLPIQHFRAPLTSNTPKLYVFTTLETNEVLYVGQTKRSISARLRAGFAPSSTRRSNGYAGYQFRELGTAHMHVFMDEEWLQHSDATISQVELIEAELCFLIRQQTGKWPSYQNEIHFGPHTKAHSSWAKQIFEAINQQLPVLTNSN